MKLRFLEHKRLKTCSRIDPDEQPKLLKIILAHKASRRTHLANDFKTLLNKTERVRFSMSLGF
jgi:hypothetical protein